MRRTIWEVVPVSNRTGRVIQGHISPENCQPSSFLPGFAWTEYSDRGGQGIWMGSPSPFIISGNASWVKDDSTVLVQTGHEAREGHWQHRSIFRDRAL